VTNRNFAFYTGSGIGLPCKRFRSRIDLIAASVFVENKMRIYAAGSPFRSEACDVRCALSLMRSLTTCRVYVYRAALL